MSFQGKIVYQPKGKALEYSKWAANFYNGCSAACEYCFNRKGRSAKILGCTKPVLKKSITGYSGNNNSLNNEHKAISIFEKEIIRNLSELRKHGLFFNFVSDPMLHDTISLNTKCMRIAILLGIPVKILTKQTWWVHGFLYEVQATGTFWDLDLKNYQKYVSFGFTLTGHDELEPGTSANMERIASMKNLHDALFSTWASIEPVINVFDSIEMIGLSQHFCDLFKIGALSGAKYSQTILNGFIEATNEKIKTPIYWKNSILKAAGIERKDLPQNCVTSDFNLFKNANS